MCVFPSRRLVRLKVHMLYNKKNSCTDGGNPTKNSIFEWPVTLSLIKFKKIKPGVGAGVGLLVVWPLEKNLYHIIFVCLSINTSTNLSHIFYVKDEEVIYTSGWLLNGYLVPWYSSCCFQSDSLHNKNSSFLNLKSLISLILCFPRHFLVSLFFLPFFPCFHFLNFPLHSPTQIYSNHSH